MQASSIPTGPVLEFNHVAVLHRERAEQIQKLNRDRGIGAHQAIG